MKFNPSDRRPETPAVRARLSRDDREYLLACLVRIPELFLQGVQHVLPTLWSSEDASLAYVWRAVLNVTAQHQGTLPQPPELARTLVELEVRNVLQQARAPQKDIDEVLGTDQQSSLFEWVFDYSEQALGLDAGRRLLQQFLQEQSIDAPLRQLFVGLRSDESIKNPTQLVETIQKKQAAIDGLTESPIFNSFATRDINDLPDIKIHTTGVPFLDSQMNGGQAGGEAYLLLGPNSGGKTVLALQIAVAGARYQVASGLPGYWYYFSYEMPVIADPPELLFRFYSHAASIHSETLETKPLRLSSRAEQNWKDYERQRYAHQFAAYHAGVGEAPPGESDRYLAAVESVGGVDSRLNLIDYSGAKAGVGVGGLQEIKQVLHAEQMRGRKVAGFVIDYAGLCVQRYVNDKNMDPRVEYNLLNSFMDEVRFGICTKLNCTGWVLHQLIGEAGKRAPTAKMHHSDAQGARGMGNQPAFCFVLGNRCDKTGMLLLHRTKARRAAPEKSSVLRLDGHFAEMLNASHEFTVQHGQFVSIDDLQHVGAVPVGAPEKAKPRPRNDFAALWPQNDPISEN